MSRGRVYLWQPDPAEFVGGHVVEQVVPLLRLDAPDDRMERLSGRFVRVRNGGVLNEPGDGPNGIQALPIGDARPNAAGDFLFDPGRGGGRMDTHALAKPHWRERYRDASHFGETNTYYHLDRIASYVDSLLHELGRPSLPRVTAVVNAHHAVTEVDGVRDGIRRDGKWLAFQGAHYRLPSRRYDVPEPSAPSRDGEIHLGPGRELLEQGAIVRAAGPRYRANASHNAGILYHEYGHHIARHTADFRANALRRPDRQDNRKTPMDEGTCDYWAATMLGVPHIWAWHQRHDEAHLHPRSLASPRTMADYDGGRGSDPHVGGTIWGAALWDLRSRVAASAAEYALDADRLVLAMLVELGRSCAEGESASVSSVCHERSGFMAGLKGLLEADHRLFAGRYSSLIRQVFAMRGILIGGRE